MEKRESLSEDLSEVKNEINDYVQNRIDLTKLQLAEDLSRFISRVAIKLVLFYIGLFVLIFISMAAAYAIGTYLNSTELGFMIVSGIYFIIGIIFYLFKGLLIQTPVIKTFVQLFFPNYSRYDKD